MKIRQLHKNLALSTGLLLVLMITAIGIAPVFAVANLWFYSYDPIPSGNVLPDPQISDPNYVGPDANPWLTESIVINSADWSSPFSIWLACHQFDSLDTVLVISVTQAAASAISQVTITTPEGTEVITSWTSKPGDADGNWAPDNLSPHGVFNSAEFGGYAEVDVGDLYSLPDNPYKAKIDIQIVLGPAVTPTSDMIVHFDAFGQTSDGKDTKNPYSHDLNFNVPEPGPILASITAFAVLAVYGIKRRKV